MAKGLWLQHRMGLEVTPAASWPGRGIAYLKQSFEELNERTFYRRWQQLIAEEPREVPWI